MGQTIITDRPVMSSMGTDPVAPVPSSWKRESLESLRWSPMTHTLPGGTVMSKLALPPPGVSPGLM